MKPAASSTHRPITESPWYWAYLFCTGALIALVVIGPKYAQRQTQIEQNSQKRQWAAQLVAGKTPSDAPNTSDAQSIPLWPLFVVLGSVLSVAWIKLIRDHLRRRTLAAKSSTSVETQAIESGLENDDSPAAGSISVNRELP